MIPASTPATRSLYDAARTAVVVFDRADRGWLSVAGGDRASFLHALFTNDIAALTAGRGCYTAYLTPQGRMISDFVAYELGDHMLLGLDQSLAPAMAARLDQLIFTEDVQVTDATGTFGSVVLVGPAAARAAASLAEGLTADNLQALPDHGHQVGRFAGEASIVLRVTDLGEPGFELVVAAAQRAALDAAVAERRLPRGDEALAEMLRIEGAVPKFLRDMDTETIPLEAGIESRAISMTKGCYVGQEVIVRVLHRGHGRVAERLVTLELEGGEVPAVGAEVHADGRRVGRVTSSTMSIALGRPIALAYVHRDFIAPGTNVQVGGVRAVVRHRPVAEKPVAGK